MSYVKTQWVNGDTITADKLNHIEAGIEANETENSLLKSQLEEITVTVSCLNDGYIGSDGVIHSTTSGGHKFSDLIDIEYIERIEYRFYAVGATIGYICFYDESTAFVSGVSPSVTNDYVDSQISVPTNARYIRCCIWYTNRTNQYFKLVGINSGKINARFSALSDDIADLNTKTIVEFSTNISGKYLDKNDGIPRNAPTNNPSISDFVLLIGSKIYYTIRFAGNTPAYICFYDANKDFISSFTTDATTWGTGSVDVPQNAMYARFAKWYADAGQIYYASVNDDDKLSEYIATLYASSEKIPTWLPYADYLRDSILKPINFNGGNIYLFGDSIAAGVCSPNLGNAGTEKWASLFASHVGATLHNEAVSGSCITDVDGVNSSVVDKINALTADNVDVVMIAAGINDYWSGKTLGVFGDTYTNTFYGALRVICTTLQTNYPNTKVIFITPANITKVYSGLEHTLNDYRKAIYEVATYFKYNVIDGASLGLPNEKNTWANAMIDDSDGVHPTILGHHQYFMGLCTKIL